MHTHLTFLAGVPQGWTLLPFLFMCTESLVRLHIHCSLIKYAAAAVLIGRVIRRVIRHAKDDGVKYTQTGNPFFLHSMSKSKHKLNMSKEVFAYYRKRCTSSVSLINNGTSVCVFYEIKPNNAQSSWNNFLKYKSRYSINQVLGRNTTWVV